MSKVYGGYPTTGGYTISIGSGGGGGAGAVYGPAGQNYTLTSEKIYEHDRFMRFLELNPDVAERYAVYKTYEILRDKHEEK